MATRSPMDSSEATDVGHLAAVAAAAVEVDDDAHDGRRQAEGQVVDGEGGHGARHVGQALGLHLVDGVAGQAGPGGGHVAEAADEAAAGREAVLPLLGAVHGRRTGALGVGPPRRLPAQLAPPGQERRRRRGRRAPRPPARPPTARPASARARCAPRQRVGGAQDRGRRRRRPATARRSPARARRARARRTARRRRGPRRGSRPTPVRSGRQDAVAHAEARRGGLHRPHVQPGDDGVVDVALGQAGVLQRRREGLAGQAARRAPRRSAPPRRASPPRPGTRQRSRNSSLAAPRPTSSATAPSGAQTKAAAPSPLSRSSAEPASPVRRSERTASVVRPRPPEPAGAGQRLQQRPQRGARGPGEVVGARRRGPARARRAPSSRWSCRGTPGPAWRGTGPAPTPRPGPTARRPPPRLHPSVVVSSS